MMLNCDQIVMRPYAIFLNSTHISAVDGIKRPIFKLRILIIANEKKIAIIA
jgi:hypothetical protein